MSDGNFLLAIDQGTTGTTVLIIDVTKADEPEVIGRGTQCFEQYYPKASWVEHDLDQIWSSVEKSTSLACQQAESNNKNFSKNKIQAIGITNQRETLCFFDRETRKPVHNAIVWQCNRSSEICERLKADEVEGLIRNKTGLVVDPYFSGTKFTWVMENIPEVSTAIKNKSVLVGTIDSWLISQLTAGQSFATEASNASRTLFFDIHTGSWDQELMNLLSIPSTDILPELKDSADLFGKTKGLSFLPDGIPITGVLGDQQAALAGQACFEVGSGKCTYGTGAFLLVNQGSSPILSKNGLLTTVAWSIKGKLSYAFEGSAFIAGAAMQFLRDQIGIIDSVDQIEKMAENCRAAPELYFVPALAGLGAPDWDPGAKGAFLGLTRGTTDEQIVRAGLEGISFQVCDLIQSIEADLGSKVSRLNVDGGACANELLMQIQSNFGNFEIDQPKNLETTAFGAAMMAGLGCGLYDDISTLKGVRKRDRLFSPDTSDAAIKERESALNGWKRAKKAVQVFSGDLSNN